MRTGVGFDLGLRYPGGMPSSPPTSDTFQQALRAFDVSTLRSFMKEGRAWPSGSWGAPPWSGAVDNLLMYLGEPTAPLARRAQHLPQRWSDPELLVRWGEILDLLVATGQDASQVMTDRQGRSVGGCLHELAAKGSVRPLPNLFPFAQALLEKVPATALTVVNHQGLTASQMIRAMDTDSSSYYNLKTLTQAFDARLAKQRQDLGSPAGPSRDRGPSRRRS